MKIYSELCGKLSNILNSLDDIFGCLCFEYFAGLVRLTVYLSVSISLHFSFNPSIGLNAVSFKSSKNVDVFLPQPEIKASISLSKGINGSGESLQYFGRFSTLNPLYFA